MKSKKTEKERKKTHKNQLERASTHTTRTQSVCEKEREREKEQNTKHTVQVVSQVQGFHGGTRKLVKQMFE